MENRQNGIVSREILQSGTKREPNEVLNALATRSLSVSLFPKLHSEKEDDAFRPKWLLPDELQVFSVMVACQTHTSAFLIVQRTLTHTQHGRVLLQTVRAPSRVRDS